METYKINHVMSADFESGIFTDIVGYFKKYSPPWITHHVTVTPIDDADIYHYHRPHLESKLRHPGICTVHHDLEDPDAWHSKHRFLPRYNEAETIICLNETQKVILTREGISEEKLRVIPHGYNTDILRIKSQKKDDNRKITIGMASRRYGRRVKGEAYLFELAKLLNPDRFSFILVGQGRAIDALMLRKMGYSAKFYERFPYRLFQSFYESIDVLLMCSSHEGGPANIPEALATGTPVFSSEVGMSRDMIKNKKNGIFLTLESHLDAELINDTCFSCFNHLQKMKDYCIEHAPSIKTWRETVNDNISAYSAVLRKDMSIIPVIEASDPLSIGTLLDLPVMECVA
ncbi:MAG: glycosyltransferase [Desulfovibrionaceae bacterium]|nr:glycosyltransferase [Desulfovibrionaceae bacterium]